MELKFLVLTFIPLFAALGSTEADRRFGGQQWNNGNRTVYIPFRQPGTTPPPIYTANSFGASNRSNIGSVSPSRWSGPQPTTVGHGLHGHNQHRFPPYNGTVGTTQYYRPNENQFGNRNNATSLYPSLAGLGNANNAYRPTTQGTTGNRPFSPYPIHDGHLNYQSGGNQYRPTAPTGSNFPQSYDNGHPTYHSGGNQYRPTIPTDSNFPQSYDSGHPTYHSGGNQYRPTALSRAGVWNGTSGSNSPQPHGNYQNAYGNEYRPAMVQGATGNGAWNGQHNFQTGQAHYNQTGGRQPVHSGY